MRVLFPFMLGILGILILISVRVFQSVWKMESIISTITDTPEDVISRVIDVIEKADTGTPAPDDPVVVPESPKLLKNTIIPHTIQGCPPCEYDKRVMYPAYKKAGWTMADPQDETTNPPPGSRYPWYEIFDVNGKRTIHVGSLSTYKKK